MPSTPYERALIIKIEQLEGVIRDAAKLQGAVIDIHEATAKEQRQRLARELEQMRTDAHNALTAELESDRKLLADLDWKIYRAKAVLSHIQAAADLTLPSIPKEAVPATERGVGLPSESGVYFVWRDDVIVYVGQSVNISQRARTPNHSNIHPGDSISWIPFRKDQLNWAEYFYIGHCRPIRNFGGVS